MKEWNSTRLEWKNSVDWTCRFVSFSSSCLIADHRKLKYRVKAQSPEKHKLLPSQNSEKKTTKFREKNNKRKEDYSCDEGVEIEEQPWPPKTKKILWINQMNQTKNKNLRNIFLVWIKNWKRVSYNFSKDIICLSINLSIYLTMQQHNETGYKNGAI